MLDENPHPTHAIVRPPGRRFVAALTKQKPPLPIDVDLARAQHEAYTQALRALGLEVWVLEPDERFPDGCFVQDLAVIYGSLAVVCRPGASSRQGEELAIAEALASHKQVVHIEAPGTLEGGDVLRVGQRLFVGLSRRTNRSGMAQLRRWVEPLGATVVPVPIEDGLHLMTGCAYVGKGMLLAAGSRAALPQFLGLDVIFVPPEEAYGANCLAIRDQVILPEGCPRVQRALEQRGFGVWTVPMSEFAKADGGVTCLSLLW
ncbi:MAG: dimethylarginine dimethylaminohydrolase family protein [Anaerolineae bacterium]